MLRITGLEVNNIGAFGHIDLQFQEKPDVVKDKAEIHIFTGENGTGKSTLLEFLTNPINRHYSRQDKIEESYRERTKKSFFKISYLQQNNITDFTSFGSRDVTVSPLLFETGYYNKVRRWNLEEFDIAFFAYSGYRRITHTPLSAIREVSTNPLENATNFNSSVNPQILIEWIANAITKESLSIVNKNLEKSTRYRKSIERIENSLSEIISKEVKFLLKDEPLAVAIKIDGSELTFDLLPDGLKSIISWLGDLLMRLDRLKWAGNVDVLDRNFILFLDEIEVHLHPAWQRKILPAVQKLFKNAQIFISTHSPFVVNSVDGAWIYKLVKEGNDSKLATEPFLSEDAKSYQHVLQEVFDIKEDFGPEQEKKLNEFYTIKKDILQGKEYSKSRLKELIDDLSDQTREMDALLGAELRQLRKTASIDFL